MTLPETTATVPFRTALRAWVRIAANSFGGPAGQIAVMHRIVVDEHKWLSEQRFLHALNYCMLLPGPEAQQLATYIGWLLHGVRGGLVAGTLFILPGFLSILLLSVLYVAYQDVVLVAGLFFGLKPAVLALVAQAAGRIGRRVLRRRFALLVSAAAFAAIFFFNVPFPFIIVGAGLLGLLAGRVGWLPDEQAGVEHGRFPPLRAALPRALRVLALGLLAWLGPLVVLALLLGPQSVFVTIGRFFSETAVVGFGGAYAVLAYIAQQAVDVYGWLLPGEMLDGLGMAETTPGPLVQVVQFVGFLGAYRQPAPFTPLVAGVLGALVTTWATFAPCFLWIFLGAPYVEALRGQRALNHALAAITAAVVGVILNLAVWFALNTLFGLVETRLLGPLRLTAPAWRTLDWAALAIAAGAFAALFRTRADILLTLAGSALAGLLVVLLRGG